MKNIIHLLLFTLLFVQQGLSQATLTIGSNSGLAGSAISVNITATGISDMQGFQFTVDYNTARLSYTGCSAWSGGTNASAVQITHIPMQGKITFVYNDAIINIGSGLFFTMTFSALGSGVAAISWGDVPTSRELSTSAPAIIPCNYANGQITVTSATVPANLNLANIIFQNGQSQCYNALQVITVGGTEPSFLVQNGSSVTIIAGQKVRLLAGVTVYSGGYFHGSISSGQYCTPVKSFEETASPHSVPLTNASAAAVSQEVLFTIYPNPTTGKFTCEIHSGSTEPVVKLRVYGLLGNLVLEQDVVHSRMTELSLDDKPAGLYIITARIGDQAGSARIIKQ
jgi:hypothetical protein